MERPDREPTLLGDWDDPWVRGLAGALPAATVIWACPGELPHEWPAGQEIPKTLVVHRSIPTPGDAARLTRLIDAAEPTPKVVLCVGPHGRMGDWERWAGLVDVTLPEATARETIARHLAGFEPTPRSSPGPRVAIMTSNWALRNVLADAVVVAGYPVEVLDPRATPASGGLAVWDAPVLETSWPDELARIAVTRRVVAMLSFADRAMVTLARERGASACLELPCDLDDLTHVLDRLATRRAEPAHELPPSPTPHHVRSRDRQVADRMSPA